MAEIILMQKKKSISKIKQVADLIEFRVFLVIFFAGLLIYPFVRYKNLENSWEFYCHIFGTWASLIVVLFILSLAPDDTQNSEDL